MSRPWMPMYWGDYLRDTQDFTATEHGVYLLLIAHYWQHGGLPITDAALSRLGRCNIKQWVSIRETIAAKFQPGWKHKRIDLEIEKTEKRVMQRALAGRKGGLASSVAASKRSSNRLSNRQAIAQANGAAIAQATGHQPQKNNITSTSTVAARAEIPSVENPPQNNSNNIPNNISAVGPATALPTGAPPRPPETTPASPKWQPRKKEGKLDHGLEPGTQVGPDVWMRTVGKL